MLLDIATKFFRERSTIEDVRAQLQTEAGYDAELWTEIAELGWTAIALPESYGGIGAGLTDLVTIVEPMGRHLFASPFVHTQVLAQALIAGGSKELCHEWLPRIVEGAIGSLATTESDGNWDLEKLNCTAAAKDSNFVLAGTKTFVLDAAVADVILVSATVEGAPAIALLEKAQIVEDALQREIVIDETRRSYRLSLAGIEVPGSSLITGDAALRALEAIRSTALLLTSAESCGGTAATLNLILEYLKSRTQFDRLIGSYQALKHPTVDVMIGLERSRSHLYHAASLFDESVSNDADKTDRSATEVALRMAKAESSDAFAFAGDRAIQFHGAVGFTYECDAQLYLRRALWNQYQYGDSLHHRKRLAELLLL